MKRLFFILVLFAAQNMNAQLATSFAFGTMSLPGSSASTFSGPILLSSDKGCIRVSNGIVVFSATSTGSALFNPSCSENSSVDIIAFKLIPNPAPGNTRIFMVGPIAPTDRIQLLISDLSGRLIQNRSCIGSDFFAGYVLNTKLLAAGLYVVSLEHKGKTHTLKLINTLY